MRAAIRTIKLGVNIDHVATLREARGGKAPDPIAAAIACEKAGCDSIVCHLREDRRHINDADVRNLRRTVSTMFNLEMSIAAEIVGIARRVGPDQATLVPEKRAEVTTEGGLDVKGAGPRLRRVIAELQRSGIDVSLFVDPVKTQIDASLEAGATVIELHTGEYANASSGKERLKRLKTLERSAGYARSLGLVVNAGHGLDYDNVKDVAAIRDLNELNIGHSIVARAVFTGIGAAVEEMLGLIR